MKRSVVLAVLIGMLFPLSFASAQYLTSAKLYMKLAQFEKAEASAVTATQKDPDDEEGWFVLGQARYELKKYVEMLEAFDKAFALDPEEHGEEIGRYRLKVWALSHNDGVKYYNAGRDTASYFQTAINSFRAATLAMPDSVETYYVYALAYYGNKQTDEAIKVLNASLVRKPDQPKVLDLLAKFHSQQAREKADAKDEAGSKQEYEAAIAAYEKYRQTDPTNTDVNMALIDLYERLSLKEKALAMTRDAVTADPNNRDLRYVYGVYLMKQDNIPGAIEQFSTVESQKPDTVDVVHMNAVYNLGVAYLNWGVAMKKDAEQKAEEAAKAKKKGFKEDMSYKEKFKSAVTYFEKSAEMKKDDPFVWQQLGRLYANLNMPKEADAAYKKYDALSK